MANEAQHEDVYEVALDLQAIQDQHPLSKAMITTERILGERKLRAFVSMEPQNNCLRVVTNHGVTTADALRQILNGASGVLRVTHRNGQDEIQAEASQAVAVNFPVTDSNGDQDPAFGFVAVDTDLELEEAPSEEQVEVQDPSMAVPPTLD